MQTLDSKTITIKDIARLAGVAKSTVSEVLNNNRRMRASKATASRPTMPAHVAGIVASGSGQRGGLVARIEYSNGTLGWSAEARHRFASPGTRSRVPHGS